MSESSSALERAALAEQEWSNLVVPDWYRATYNLAVGLEHLNQPKLALTYYRKAIDLSFQKGRANFDQNRVIERIGQLSARGD